MQSKNALSNLKNRYIAVLKKCNLINTFGALALATMCAMPTTAFSATNPAGSTVAGMEATAADPVLENYGTILDGASYTDLWGTTRWVGMYGDSTTNASYNFTNIGGITINKPSTDEVYGMLTSSLNGNHKLTNSGTITVNGNNTVYGMNAVAGQNGSHSLSNSGTIGVSGTINANGMRAVAGQNGSHSLSNSGTIGVSGIDSVSGMYAQTILQSGNHKLTNSGTITVNGNTLVYGMYAISPNGSHSLTNSGTITVNGTSGNTVSGMNATSNNGNHSLTNSGIITVSGSGFLVGMYVQGTGTPNLSNTGFISATATTGFAFEAFEAYGAHSYNIGTWATTLRTWSANDIVFGGEGSVNLANSNLIFRPQVTAAGVELGVDYALNNLVVMRGSAVDVALSDIGSIKAEVPFLKAVVTGGSTTSSAFVRLEGNVSDETLPVGSISFANLNTVLTQTGNVTKALSDLNNFFNLPSGLNMGSEMADENKWLSFGKLYGSVGDNNKYSLNSKSAGITAGASYAFNNAFSAGFHFDYNYSENESDYINNDANSLALGLHSNYFVNPNWFVGGQLTGSYSMNDVEYKPQSYLSTEDDYDSYALFARVNTGYHFVINNENVITPEIGLSYLYTNSDDYDFNFANLPMYNMAINNDNYSALYADFMLTWKGNYVQEKSTLVPSLGLGIRQNLTGSDVDSAVNVLGSRFETTANSDDTTFLANAGLEWQRETFTFGAYYDGEYGSEQQNHTGSLKLTYKF